MSWENRLMGQHPMFAAIWIDYDDTETVSLPSMKWSKAHITGMYD
jgi:hypothetical protein